MAELRVPPPTRIAIGSATVGGQRVDLFLTPEWARYFDALNSQVVVTSNAVGQPGAPGITGAAGFGVCMEGDGASDDLCIPGPPGQPGPQGAPGPALFLLADGEREPEPFMVPQAPFLGAVTTYTPTVLATSGAFTSVSATGRYQQIGKYVMLSAVVTITANGTAAGAVFVSLPAALGNAAASAVATGRADSVSGKQLQGRVLAGSQALNVFNYDNTYPGASGETLMLSLVYEVS